MKKARASRPIAVDLFAGAGGLSLGFEQAGFDIAAAVEIDPIHCAVHHFNFPTSPVICESVTDLTGEQIRARAGIGDRDIDVVCGGAPCQGFSTIGKRALDDSRNQLVYHYCRLVQELQPKYAVFENVRGLTLGKHKKFLEEIIEALEGFGYSVLSPYQVLNAEDYGTPQSRRRLFLIAARKGQAVPKYPTPSARTTVREAIFDLPNADDFEALYSRDWVKARFKKGSTYSRRLRGVEIDPDDFSYERVWDSSLMTSSTRTEHTELSKQRFTETPSGTVEPVSRFLKLDPDGVCNSLRAGTDTARGAFTSPRPIHPIHPRVITVREAARLHSYPDWFRFHATKWHGFRQIGNSVPPLLARAVAGEVVKAMGIKPKKPAEVLALGSDIDLNLRMAEAVNRFGLARSPIANRIRREESRAASSQNAANEAPSEDEIEHV
jgi:DNA (cytosine-5)-methyltransferase 1